MKKSRLIIAAAALLGVSVAATTTSTIAWFTSTNAATVTVGNIVAVNASANLNVKITGNAAHGTAGTLTGGDGNGSTASFDISKLRDASLDLEGEAEQKIASYPVRDADGKIASFAHKDETTGYDSTDAKKGSYATTIGTDDIYYYAEFDIEFTMGTVTSDKYNIYFDGKNSTLTTNASNTSSIDSSIRFGLRNATELKTTPTTDYEYGATAKTANGNVVVWANNYDMASHIVDPGTLEATTDDSNVYNQASGLKYVQYNDSGVVGTGSYASDGEGESSEADEAFYPTTGAKYWNTTPATPVEADVTAGSYGHSSRPAATTDLGYLGNLQMDTEGAKTLTYHAYIWFEGEDIFCINSAISTYAYSLGLSFFALKAE
ncbi:MAG: hypothetical protein WCR97_05055 [Bacilli bacterium]